MPSPTRSTRYRDGGQRGEELLSAIVQGAPQHLADGGHVAIVCDLVDVENYHQKLDQWWSNIPRDALLMVTADRDEILFSVPHSHAPFGQCFERYNEELDRWVGNFRSARLRAVNFGYILLWRRPSGGRYHLRTIHNPSRPIHDRVAAWREQVQLLEREEAKDYFLQLHPRLHLREERSVDGVGVRCELRVPEDSFFTTYVVSRALVRELRALHENQPRLGDRINRHDAPWIHDLVEKGVLVLSRRRREVRVADSQEPETDLSVEELQTKTTPTCLSSYLSS